MHFKVYHRTSSRIKLQKCIQFQGIMTTSLLTVDTPMALKFRHVKRLLYPKACRLSQCPKSEKCSISKSRIYDTTKEK